MVVFLPQDQSLVSKSLSRYWTVAACSSSVVELGSAVQSHDDLWDEVLGLIGRQTGCVIKTLVSVMNKRLNISLDIARVIEYLHTLTRQNRSYIHRGLKPSNILLGDDLRARVSDFSLVRSTAEGKDSFTAEKSAGKIGYLPSEYIMTGWITRKLDIYSFGVVLKELLTGQKAVDKRRSEDPQIALWFINLVKEDSFENVIEETIQITEDNRGSISEVAKLASYCCAKTPEKRPDMSYAVTVLASLTKQWKPSEVEEMRDEFLEELGKKWWHEQQRVEGNSGPSSPARQ